MHQRPRNILRQLIQYYGPALHADPRRVEAFLQDLCGQYPREIFVLVHAQEQQIPKELLAAGPLAGEQALWQRLSRRLQERLAMTAEAADWAVESWALALGVAPARYGYPRPLRLLFDYLPRMNRAPLGQSLFNGRSFGKFGVQWNHGQPSWRGGSVWTAASLILLVLLGSVALVYRSNPTEALNQFWQGDETEVEQQLSSGRFADQLKQIYPLPREVRIGNDLVAVHADPSEEALTLGMLGPPGAAVTIDDYTADGRWLHISNPVAGWIANRSVTLTAQGSAAGAAVQLSPMIGRVTVAGLRVRQAPTLESAVLGELAEGEQVLILAAFPDRSWYQIIEPIRGWISGAYIVEDTAQDRDS